MYKIAGLYAWINLLSIDVKGNSKYKEQHFNSTISVLTFYLFKHKMHTQQQKNF